MQRYNSLRNLALWRDAMTMVTLIDATFHLGLHTITVLSHYHHERKVRFVSGSHSAREGPERPTSISTDSRNSRTLGLSLPNKSHNPTRPTQSNRVTPTPTRLQLLILLNQCHCPRTKHLNNEPIASISIQTITKSKRTKSEQGCHKHIKHKHTFKVSRLTKVHHVSIICS